jgi:hypothetical protein
MLELITDRNIYKQVILDRIPKARRFVWMATSDLKDLHVDKGRRMVPFLEVLSDLVDKQIEIRLLHAKEPGPAFRRDFDKYPTPAWAQRVSTKETLSPESSPTTKR